MVDYQVSLINQFLGTFIISFIFFLIALGILYLWFAPRSNRPQGFSLVGIGAVLTLILYILGKYMIQNGYVVPWWNIFKVEAFFADLGALTGVMIVVGMIMVIIIQIDRRH